MLWQLLNIEDWHRNYNSLLNGFIKYLNRINVDPDVVNENLVNHIIDYLELTADTRNSTYITSSTAAILDYYKPKYGDMIEYKMQGNQLVYKLGNPVKHWRITDSIKNTKIRDEGETKKQAYPLNYQEVSELLVNAQQKLHPFTFLQFRLIVSMTFQIMCRIQNTLDIKFEHVSLQQDLNLNVEYLLIEIPWMKIGQRKDRFYKLYDYFGEDNTHVVKQFKEYLMHGLFCKINANPRGKGYSFFLTSVSNRILGDMNYDIRSNVKLDTVLKLLKVLLY